MFFELPVAEYVNATVTAIKDIWLFEALSTIMNGVLVPLQDFFLWIPWWAMILILVLLAWKFVGKGMAAFTLVSLLFITTMNMWDNSMSTLALVLASTFFSLLIGIPVGIWSARNDSVFSIVRPILDLMQTMPSFVYLIPAIFFFSIGKVPAMFSTIIFAMPPAVRLTNLGIRQVSKEIIEAALSFGSTPQQLLYKVQLPLAKPSIMAGVNQTIMLALSMVVIASMVGAGGLGGIVLRGVQRADVGIGFEGGLAVVILAIILDRISQSFGASKEPTS